MSPRFAVPCLLLLASPALAQAGIRGTPYVFQTAVPLERLGAAVVVMGDLNGNGADDVIVGSPGGASPGPSSGRLRAVDGSTLQQIWTVPGSNGQDRLGSSLSITPDLDGDGLADIVAVLSAAGTAGPSLLWFSSASGALLGTQLLPGFSGFGTPRTAAPWRDLNGNGTIDYAVGVLVNGSLTRSVAIVDWQVGVLATVSLPLQPGIVQGETPLCTVMTSEDLDADGIMDIVIGDPAWVAGGILPQGVVQAVSGATLTPLWSTQGTRVAGYMGTSLISAPDLDGDGVRELVAGVPGPPSAVPPDAGTFSVLSGATGRLLMDIESPAASVRTFGRTIARGGPLGGTSETFVAAAMPFGAAPPGTAALYRFRLGPGAPQPLAEPFRVVDAAFLSSLGQPTIAGGGDFNGDGRADFVLGIEAIVQPSSVHFFLNAGTRSFTGPSPVNQTLALASAAPSDEPPARWRLSAPATLAGASNALVVGLSGGAAPLLATVLLVDITMPASFVVLPGSFDAAGVTEIYGAGPGAPISLISGLNLVIQGFALDPAAPQGLVSSNGLQVVL